MGYIKSIWEAVAMMRLRDIVRNWRSLYHYMVAIITALLCIQWKIVAGNKAGKNICFMSRGEYADPKIAYNGILMNYWDVYDCMDEVEEPTDDDWLNAVSNLFDSYTYDVKNTDVDKFKMSDVMNVYRIINL